MRRAATGAERPDGRGAHRSVWVNPAASRRLQRRGWWSGTLPEPGFPLRPSRLPGRAGSRIGADVTRTASRRARCPGVAERPALVPLAPDVGRCAESHFPVSPVRAGGAGFRAGSRVRPSSSPFRIAPLPFRSRPASDRFRPLRRSRLRRFRPFRHPPAPVPSAGCRPAPPPAEPPAAWERKDGKAKGDGVAPIVWRSWSFSRAAGRDPPRVNGAAGLVTRETGR